MTVTTFDAGINTKLCKILQVHAKQCKVDIPLVPPCLRYVSRITVIDHLGAVDLHIQLPGVARTALEVQHQCLNAGFGLILRNSKGAFAL